MPAAVIRAHLSSIIIYNPHTMEKGEVFVPCPACRTALRYRHGSDGRLFTLCCLFCGRPFSAQFLDSVRNFLVGHRPDKVMPGPFLASGLSGAEPEVAGG